MTTFFRSVLFLITLIGALQISSAAAGPPNESRYSGTIIDNITKTLHDAVETRNYRALQKNATNEKALFWDVCGSTDTDSGELSSGDIVQMLLKNSGNVKIYFNPEADILYFSENEYISIYTEGWASEYPFLGFLFVANKRTNGWSWKGVCYSVNPPGRIDKKTGKTTYAWPNKPSLPRPSPQIFESDETLRARIIEMVKLREFHALKPYATGQKLLLSECNRSMIENNNITGKNVSIDDAVELLKQNSKESKKIRTTRGTYRYRETTGWSGDYPYFAFWLSRGEPGWVLSGLSYCKQPHFSLILKGEEKTKYLMNLEKELSVQQ